MTKRLIFGLAAFLLPAAGAISQTASILDSLAIEVTGVSREFAFTNKQAAFFYGETGGENRAGWQGFNVFGHEFMDDYLLLVDGKELLKQDAARTIVYPDHLVREYPGGIVEQLRPADSLAAFGIVLTSNSPVALTVIPLLSDARSPEDLVVTTDQTSALIAQRRHIARTADSNYPVWLALHGRSFAPVTRETRRGGRYSPIALTSTARSTTHHLAFAAGDTEHEAIEEARSLVENPARLFRARRERMERLLRETQVRTADPRFDRSLAWAKLSLDALIMNQITKGIFAGLPWFNNYWGRDTFISLPGACLVTGRFAEARRILRSFAAFQQLDTASTDFGRIPNLVTTTEKAYNTADGTPRFVMMAYEYVVRSGDSAFAAEIYPAVLRSIEGTLRHHMDSLGFLTHGDAETWMDAVGPDGPWSPRGNRANDIQALWSEQLRTGALLARIKGDSASSRRWTALRETLVANFRTFFLRDSTVTDHLNRDGAQDTRLRPNQIFTLPLLDETRRRAILRTVTGNLTYEYGVASLWQGDDGFHPYHQYDPYYPKDAAYHNGTVWTWVQGPVISELCRLHDQETAYAITRNTTRQILDRGAVGTQSELLDALARPGEKEPRLSGTFSQAWNLAEFVRNFYDDYLGARITRFDHRLVLRPRLPEALGDVSAVLNLDGTPVPVEVRREREEQTVTIDGRRLRKGGSALVSLPTGAGSVQEVELSVPRGSILRLSFKDSSVTSYLDGDKWPSIVLNHQLSLIPGQERYVLTTPVLRSGLKSLRGPEHPLLSHSQVRRQNPAATPLFEVSDPELDDTGVSATGTPLHYTYPGNSSFVPGCLDITEFRVLADDSLSYFRLRFRALSDPGWHPEYGFQLTLAAIAIDQDRVSGSGQRHVPANASFLLPDDRAYERLILVGGGVRIEDKDGKILAAYVPTEGDASDPIGRAGEGVVAFAIPHDVLGSPERNWRITILVGAQDDHGGAGLGEFRTVNKEKSDWNGGGKERAELSNIYDMLTGH